MRHATLLSTTLATLSSLSAALTPGSLMALSGSFPPFGDYYDSGEIDLRYCPTDVMWAHITKPLQGQKFRDMRAFLQNCPRDYDDDVELQTDQLAWRSMNQQVKTVASSRECVGE